jgi:hypothetical protein
MKPPEFFNSFYCKKTNEPFQSNFPLFFDRKAFLLEGLGWIWYRFRVKG